MGLTRAQQRRMFDKDESIGKGMKRAAKASKKYAKPVAKEKQSVVGRVARKLKELYYGDKTYMPKKGKKGKK